MTGKANRASTGGTGRTDGRPTPGQARGLTSAEAVGVIRHVSGLPTCASPWTMDQINRLLFLRSLYTESEWGRDEHKKAD